MAMMGKAPAPKIAPEPDADEDGGDLDAVASDLIAAIKAGDTAGVADALRAAHSVCSNYDNDGDE